jgi:hypothetical protein
LVTVTFKTYADLTNWVCGVDCIVGYATFKPKYVIDMGVDVADGLMLSKPAELELIYSPFILVLKYGD